LRLVRAIRDAGLRLDAVGIQGHWGLEHPSLEEIERGIRAYVDDGFKVMITELDIDVLPRKKEGGADLSAVEKEGLDPYKQGLPPDIQKKLADRYGALFALFRRIPQVTRVTLWGTTDGNSWLDNFPVRGRTNHPLLWDRAYQPKPALYSVLEALR
jgi:endo-1,4-beta-xylanase